MVHTTPPQTVAHARCIRPGQPAWSTGLCGASVGTRPRNRVLPLARQYRPCPFTGSRNHRTNTRIKAPTAYGLSLACRFPSMSEDFSVAWSWLTPDQQATLQNDPYGPIPQALVPRLNQVNLLGVGSRKMTSPTGQVQWYLSPAVAQFISQQS